MANASQAIEAFLDQLPPDRKEALSTVRRTVRKALPKGYEEVLDGKTIVWQVPWKRQSGTYNGKPLMYAALGSNKSGMSLYLMGLYVDPELARSFERKYRATKKRYDVGKSCVRFKRIDDLALEVVAEAVAAIDVDTFVAHMTETAGKKAAKSKKAE